MSVNISPRAIFARLVTSLVAVPLLLSRPLAAQEPHQALELKNGTVITGVVIELSETALVVERSNGTSSSRQTIPFKDLSPSTVYGAASTWYSPLDADGHQRLAAASRAVGLFAAAARHYRMAAERLGNTPDELARWISECRELDIQDLKRRYLEELALEHFTPARRLLLSILQRYPEHSAAQDVPTLLSGLSRLYDEALRRDAALAANKRARADWERGEKLIAGLRRYLQKAKDQEQSALRQSEQFRASKDILEAAIKNVRQAELDALGLRQNKKVPGGLLSELLAVEDEVVELHVRLRLHIASLHTVRGSFGSASAWVNAALSYDPTHEQALAARARIEESAAAASARSTFRRSLIIR